MDIIEYRNNMYEEIKVAANVNITDVSSEFIDYVSNVLIDAEEIEDYTESYFETSGKKNRKIQIDGFFFDQVDNSCVLIIADFLNNPKMSTITNAKIEKLFLRVEAFILHSINGYIEKNSEESSIGYGLALQIKNDIKKITKFRIFIYSDQILSKSVKSLKKEKISNIPVEVNVWDIERLMDLEFSSFGKETIEIDFNDYKIKGLPCVRGVESVKENYKAFLMTIPGNVLADLYLEHGSRLLEGNVRSFLSTRGKVNKKIRETIIKKPEMFFAYNNGIAATATEIEYEETGYGLLIKKIKNLQIINGGQTTASIANASLKKEGDISKVYVPMKLSVVDKEIADKIIPEISKSANSQNKVSDADFMSNHSFHIRVEEFSRKIFAPAVDGHQYQTTWFYERARGQYVQAQMKLTKAERKRFALKNPKNQMIKKVDLAKYLNTLDLKPYIVSKGSQASARYFDSEMKKKWDKSDIQFNQLFFKQMITMAIIYKSVEKIVSKQEWYKAIKSYRANIVTYAISIVLNEIKKKGDKILDYNYIWNVQKLPIELENQMIITTKEVYNFITRDDRLTLNVTEWCKKEICWQRAINTNWTFNDSMDKILIEKSVQKEKNVESKKTQIVKNEIDAEMEVIQRGSKYWKDMRNWAMEKKIISVIDKEIMNVAINFEYTGKLPSPKQSRRILKIREKISLEGYICD